MARPNVVFVIADQHRWDFMGYESNGVTFTPHLDALAEAGTVFRTAYCTSPLCSPCRAAIASGRYGMNSGCFTNLHELPPGSPSFVTQFRDAGYHTCAIGKTHMEIHAYDSELCSEGHRRYMASLGWREVCEISGNGMLKTGIKCAYTDFLREHGKFEEVLEFYRNWHYFMDKERKGDHGFACYEWPLEERFQETAFVGRSAVEWLRNRDGSQPFFLHVGFAAPHSPIEPCAEFMDLYREADEPRPWGVDAPPDFVADGRRGYRAMISHVDHYVGLIREAIAEQGDLENTVFVYTADHGEMAGDLGQFGKTRFFEPSVRVPLIAAGPGVRAQQENRAFVELVDLGKTFCELCGVEPHALDQGESLVPVLSGQTESHRDTAFAEMGCDRMLRDARWKLMCGDPGGDRRQLGRLHLDKPVTIPPSPCRLYDLQNDPREEHDLAQDPAAREALMRMQSALLARLNRNLQPQPCKSRGEYRPL